MTRRTHSVAVTAAMTLATIVELMLASACQGSPAGRPSGSPNATTGPTTGAPAPVAPGSAAPVTGAYSPAVDPTAFSSTVDNPYFPLRPGMRWEFRSTTPDGPETTIVTVTRNAKTIMGITCVEVRDTVRLNGTIKEDTLDWYAQHRDGTVWYFGEDTKEYENGKVTSTQGSWIAGVHGAMPGIIMPSQPQVGDRYRQEYFKGDAEDIAEVIRLGDTASVPAGSYNGMLVTKETTPLEPALLEDKYYARGVGPVLTVDIGSGGVRDELVSFTG